MLEQGSIKNRSDLALNLVRGEADQSKQVMQKRTKNEKENGFHDDTGRRVPVNLRHNSDNRKEFLPTLAQRELMAAHSS